ncbi:MAG: aldo/keto reductase [Rhodospirillales bacterium]|nr:aldo/keto reductase [Rhodospirillales bacterium]
MIAGRATTEGTQRYRARTSEAAAGHFRDVDRLAWSSIGIGTYLGNSDAATDRLVTAATVAVVGGGINVIDTAVNYRYERGEKSVGAALAELIGKGGIKRDEIVVCTKGGFLPHPDRGRWFQREYAAKGTDGIGMKDLVADSHCMHPAYLAGEIERSRANLGLQTIDVYYVHNPESQLRHVDQATFDARIAAAFVRLERAVAEGTIGAYGLATWGAFRVPEGQPGHISLARMKDLARRAAKGGADHFRFIQLPLNLGMREAVELPTQKVGGRLVPAIPAAAVLGLHPVASGSIAQGGLKALPVWIADRMGKDFASDHQRALQYTRSAPGLAAALIGMKQPAHVQENVALAKVPPLGPQAFAGLFRRA